MFQEPGSSKRSVDSCFLLAQQMICSDCSHLWSGRSAARGHVCRKHTRPWFQPFLQHLQDPWCCHSIQELKWRCHNACLNATHSTHFCENTLKTGNKRLNGKWERKWRWSEWNIERNNKRCQNLNRTHHNCCASKAYEVIYIYKGKVIPVLFF